MERLTPLPRAQREEEELHRGVATVAKPIDASAAALKSRAKLDNDNAGVSLLDIDRRAATVLKERYLDAGRAGATTFDELLACVFPR